MNVRDRRLPPFAWISLAALKHLREALPDQRAQGARNALLALAEAASLRHDPRHRDGDTLRDLSALTHMSERRLRDHLGELEAIGLVRIDRPTDHAGRDLPARYVLTDPSGSDESSDRADELDDKSSRDPSGPTRAREAAKKERTQKPPRPPRGANPAGAPGGRGRDVDAWRRDVDAWITAELPELELSSARAAVEQALLAGAASRDAVLEFLREWWPHLLGRDNQD